MERRRSDSSRPEGRETRLAVAAGVMGVGSTFVGTMEGCAALLERMLQANDQAGEAALIAREHRAAKLPLPGFGHHMHKPDDPRSIRLFEVADELGLTGPHIAAIKTLSTAIDEIYGKHITINATVDALWRGNAQHAWLHHLNALFGYQPALIREQRLMRF